MTNKPIDKQSAAELGQNIAAGVNSSQDALAWFTSQRDARDTEINAVIETNLEAAAARAEQADEAAARGESWGPLHGVPMTVKDTFEVVGMRATAGAPAFKDHRPDSNANAAQRLLDAGAIIWGKTNTPLFAGDVQTHNELFGTTSNPWDVARTPGGSSGGAAAALAAGFTPLEVGSDIGGSIRTPSHYCGTYGHKPTHGIVSSRGHIPGPPGTLAEPDLAVCGPMARTASDLALALNLLAGPPAEEPAGWRLELPESQVTSLDGLRVGLWYEDPCAPIMADMAEQFAAGADQLRSRGATVTEVSLGGYTLTQFIEPYLRLLGPVIGADMPAELLAELPEIGQAVADAYANGDALSEFAGPYLKTVGASHIDWMRADEKRFKMRQQVINFFADYDVVLTPVTGVTAPLHNAEGDMFSRVVPVDGVDRSYGDQLNWIAPATVCGLPSTSAPLGMADGLPMNMQIIGAPFADHTTIHVAHLLEQEFGEFEGPPTLS